MTGAATVQSELRWLASQSTSCLHAAEAICRGVPLVDARLASVLAKPAESLYRELRTLNLPQSVIWLHLFGLSPAIENSRELAAAALAKVAGQVHVAEEAAERLASRLDQLQAIAKRESPNLVEELLLRARPLREQWEARGPGMMREAARWSDARILVPRADILLVQPVLGGGGNAHLYYNSLRIEAVMANPHPDLPEVLRLAWMLGQLNLDMPLFSDAVHSQRLPQVAQLAMVPVTLKAAELVELARCDRPTIEAALNLWRVATPLGIDAVEMIWSWWQTYLDTRPSWPVALTALDRMLENR